MKAQKTGHIVRERVQASKLFNPKWLQTRVETLQWGRSATYFWFDVSPNPSRKWSSLLYIQRVCNFENNICFLELWTLCMYNKELHFLEQFGDSSIQNCVAAPL